MKKLKIAITHGDINGVGYEVLFKTLSKSNVRDLYIPIIYGSLKAADHYRQLFNYKRLQWKVIDSPMQARPGQVYFINCCDDALSVQPGEASPEAGVAALQALDRAMSDARDGSVDAIVTCPINKSVMPQDQFPYAGHTDYIADNCGDAEAKPLMIMADDMGLRVALATVHISLSEVAVNITPDRIRDIVMRFESSLELDFGVQKPRIALLALNPHSGDKGLIGSEEIRVIEPIVEQLFKKDKINVFGPISADGFWGAGDYRHYDGVIALYHDQGLIPFKTLAMDRGVNVTGGLPIIRTSPDHGTAFDIAGQGVASEVSLQHAIYMAIDIHRNRQRYMVANRNPLRKTYRFHGNDNEKLEGND